MDSKVSLLGRSIQIASKVSSVSGLSRLALGAPGGNGMTLPRC